MFLAVDQKHTATALGPARKTLMHRFDRVRAATLAMTAPLSPEDQQVQSMADASPTKWHLGHTNWFFDTVVLAPLNRAIGDGRLRYLFNSYYDALGDRQPRAQRGLITRPSLQEVLDYRAAGDTAVRRLIHEVDDRAWREVADKIELGLQHEEQHQELILMDIKHLLFCNPFHPAYTSAQPLQSARYNREADWLAFSGGLVDVGADGRGFSYDHEQPRHRVWLEPFRLQDSLTTSGDWLAFMNDGGYVRPELWLSDGWATVQREGWSAPLYWSESAQGTWSVFTLFGDLPIDLDAPVIHVSYYEADAFARWRHARLPTEFEWEHASASALEARSPALHPRAAANAPGLQQMAGEAWQWTASAYTPYPGFTPAPGVAAEYNGKFMSGQMVLRGGASITPAGHVRASYRNFFPPSARWPFTGVRLARAA